MRIRIGTRGSALALTQTGMVEAALKKNAPSVDVEIIEIKTSGDKKQGTEQARFGDKKDWVYELEMALLDGSIDIAVHSAKDVPGNTEPGLALHSVLARAAPYDVFVKKNPAEASALSLLPADSVIGTSSLRRKAALTLAYPYLRVIDHRGNVPTRVRKLDESEELSGIVLAAAGLKRLNLFDESRCEVIPTEILVPAMNQGILCVQYREGDKELEGLIESISDQSVEAAFIAERTCAHHLGGDCGSAIGVCALPTDDGGLQIVASVYDSQGRSKISESGSFAISEAKVAGLSIANKLLDAGAAELL